MILHLIATGAEGPLGYAWIKAMNARMYQDQKTGELSVLFDCEVPVTAYCSGWTTNHWCDIEAAIKCGEYKVVYVNTSWIGPI